MKGKKQNKGYIVRHDVELKILLVVRKPNTVISLKGDFSPNPVNTKNTGFKLPSPDQAMTTTCITHGAHILIFPYPTAGHIIPLLDLTHQFLTHGLTITVLLTSTNLPLLQPLLSTHPFSLHSLVLSSLDPPTPPQHQLIATTRALHQQRGAIIQWFKSHPSPPVAIISDFFLGWTHNLARELSVPRLVFSPSGVFAESVSNSVWRDLPKNTDPQDENFSVTFPDIPNSPNYPWWQLSPLFRHSKEGDPDWEFFRNTMLDNMASWGIVFNSFTELERVYFDHLRKELGHHRVWAVGPLLPPNDDSVGPTERGGHSSVSTHDVLTWLDRRPDHSVVYVCFGSRVTLTRREVEVLSAGLECSGVTFIWGVKEPSEGHVASDCGEIPDGYEDRVAGRGLVIKGWAPQVAILRHRAVGVFLTHCGWNSVLEGLAAGVMMLTWPMGADQFTNAKLLVDQLGVGVRVGEGTRNVPDSAELTRLLAESVGESRPERVRAMELSRAALGAVKGGSSERDLGQLVKQLNELKSESKCD